MCIRDSTKYRNIGVQIEAPEGFLEEYGDLEPQEEAQDLFDQDGTPMGEFNHESSSYLASSGSSEDEVKG